MFGFLKSKNTSSKYDQLGRAAEELISISKYESDFDVLTKGSAEIFSTIEAAEKVLGLRVTSKGLFMNFLDAADNDETEVQVKQIRYFGRELEIRGSVEERGKLVEYWIEGRRPDF